MLFSVEDALYIHLSMSIILIVAVLGVVTIVLHKLR